MKELLLIFFVMFPLFCLSQAATGQSQTPVVVQQTPPSQEAVRRPPPNPKGDEVEGANPRDNPQWVLAISLLIFASQFCY